jgi:hypothetical protein
MISTAGFEMTSTKAFGAEMAAMEATQLWKAEMLSGMTHRYRTKTIQTRSTDWKRTSWNGYLEHLPNLLSRPSSSRGPLRLPGVFEFQFRLRKEANIWLLRIISCRVLIAQFSFDILDEQF